MSKIAFLGDSITRGIGYGGVTAADTFARKIGVASGYAASDIINAGVSSNTSTQMLARLNSDVIAAGANVCVIMAGNNDAAGSPTVPVATYEANLRAMIASLNAAGVKPVLFTPGLDRGDTAKFQTYKSYVEVVDRVAASCGVAKVDVYREQALSYLYLTGLSFSGMFVDDLHLTKAGHQFVADFALRPCFAGVFSAP